MGKSEPEQLIAGLTAVADRIVDESGTRDNTRCLNWAISFIRKEAAIKRRLVEMCEEMTEALERAVVFLEKLALEHGIDVSEDHQVIGKEIDGIKQIIAEAKE